MQLFHRIRQDARPLILFALCLAATLPVLLATQRDYGSHYDEPIYVEAALHASQWLNLPIRDMPDRKQSQECWESDPTRNIHPAGLKWIYILSWNLFPGSGEPLQKARSLVILYWGIALAFFLPWALKGRFVPTLSALILLMTLPRFFAHLHFATTDIPLTATLLLMLVALDRLPTRWALLAGSVLFGFGLSIKITMLLLALPLATLILLLRFGVNRKALGLLLLLGILALGWFYLLNPSWWANPLASCRGFLLQTLTRNKWVPISTAYFGNIYSFQAPWHYPFVMFGITTPLFHLLLASAGMAALLPSGREKLHRERWVVLTGFALPFLVMLLPSSPRHDNDRYLIPAIPFLAVICAWGLEWAWTRLRLFLFSGSLPGKAVAWAGLLALPISAAPLPIAFHELHPLELSYFGELIGGLPGAARRGFEVTYLYEVIDSGTMDTLNRICAGRRVFLPLPPTDHFFNQKMREKRLHFLPSTVPEDCDFMLVYGRPQVTYWLAQEKPALEKLRKTPVLIWQRRAQNVPILLLFYLMETPA